MLLSSTPSRTSCFQQQNPKPFPSSQPHFILKSPTLSLHSPNKISRASSEGDDLVTLSRSSRRNSLNNASCLISSVVAVEGCVKSDEIENGDMMFSSSGLDVDEVMVVVLGVGVGGGGGRICGGGGGNEGCDYGGDGMDGFYRSMIEANPSSSLVLGNYAKYLKEETQKVASRAQSYFDQAVKASPDDSYVMAAYARFLWDADEEVSDTNLAASSFVHEAS